MQVSTAKAEELGALTAPSPPSLHRESKVAPLPLPEPEHPQPDSSRKVQLVPQDRDNELTIWSSELSARLWVNRHQGVGAPPGVEVESTV
jgi:hypothetical protein